MSCWNVAKKDESQVVKTHGDEKKQGKYFVVIASLSNFVIYMHASYVQASSQPGIYNLFFRIPPCIRPSFPLSVFLHFLFLFKQVSSSQFVLFSALSFFFFFKGRERNRNNNGKNKQKKITSILQFLRSYLPEIVSEF